MKIKDKLRRAASIDPEILCDKSEVSTTLGTDAKYLEEVLGITKKDLKRLEKDSLAVKARYATENKTIRGKIGVTGPHRIRWILFKEALHD